ncbi:MAG TPA: BadF/BadG/BcrA/BcrD ATPase family protein [Bryobacteraceae bacterium]|jgi:N-acetylglucosamine kinase-like BadF-type ATPase|nr:BadF/BadG/BcrA/BcrD ATPase family protein [Bryobacteraceae bacterium]
MEVILAIDGGATRTRCVAIDRAGRTLGDAERGASNHLQRSAEAVRTTLTEAVDETLRMANLGNGDVKCISAGLAGVDYDGYGAAPMLALFRELGFECCLVQGDMVIAHAAALGMRPGIVVLAGTGSATFGVDAGGRCVKVGGWGPVYGDEGSAQRISQQAMAAAARAYDGRGPATALLAALTKDLGLSDFRESISVIYGPQARDVASLCRAVHRTAAAGDEVACSLFREAAEELAEAVIAAARQLDLTHSPVGVSYQGGVAENCPLLIEFLRKRLKHHLPLADFHPPRWKPVIGAYLLGCRSLGWDANAVC